MKGEIEKFKVAKDIVLMSEAQFVAMSDQDSFARESLFALQALKNNSYLCSVAYQNKDSLKSAMLNLAAIGLTLNPVRKLAYLVPRDGKVMADISYLGLIQMALDSGAITWAKAEVVFEEDEFNWLGLDKVPEHKFNPFSDRGEIVGVYCVARLPDASHLTEVMPINEVYSIRERSKSWKSERNSPWKSDPTEMIKKTVLRRAYKSWPIKSNVDKFDKAFETFDSEFTGSIDITPSQDTGELIERAVGLLAELDKPLDKAIEFLARSYQRKIGSLEELTVYELEKFIAQLESWLDKIPKLELDENVQNNDETKTIGEENADVATDSREPELTLEEIPENQ